MNPNTQLPAMAAAETATFVPASIRTNTTVYDKDGMAQKESVTIESGRASFGAISKTLAKTDDTSRIRHIRTDEAPITLRQILDFAKLRDREIAILYDNEGKPPAGRYSYTRICLYSSSERSTLIGSAANKTQAAAHLVLPPELRGRYRFIAHTHPTFDPYKAQVNQDIRVAKGHVEIVTEEIDNCPLFGSSFQMKM